MIDVIYPLHNRVDYTKLSFSRLIHECKLYKDVKLWIYDDNSTDGSSEIVRELLLLNPDIDYYYYRNHIGNSTYCINETLKRGNAEYIYKVDNDICIPVCSFEVMIDLMPKDCGFMMMGETGDYPHIPESPKVINNNRTHIGGVGLFRRKAFSGNIKSGRRFFGFTQYQIKAKTRGWKCAEVNAKNQNLDMCQWYSRQYEYERKGWGRILNQVQSIYGD